MKLHKSSYFATAPKYEIVYYYISKVHSSIILEYSFSFYYLSPCLNLKPSKTLSPHSSLNHFSNTKNTESERESQKWLWDQVHRCHARWSLPLGPQRAAHRRHSPASVLRLSPLPAASPLLPSPGLSNPNPIQ